MISGSGGSSLAGGCPRKGGIPPHGSARFVLRMRNRGRSCALNCIGTICPIAVAPSAYVQGPVKRPSVASTQLTTAGAPSAPRAIVPRHGVGKRDRRASAIPSRGGVGDRPHGADDDVLGAGHGEEIRPEDLREGAADACEVVRRDQVAHEREALRVVGGDGARPRGSRRPPGDGTNSAAEREVDALGRDDGAGLGERDAVVQRGDVGQPWVAPEVERVASDCQPRSFCSAPQLAGEVAVCIPM